MLRGAIIAVVTVLASGPARSEGDIPIADFEGPDWAGWTAEGDAFGPGPEHGALPNQQEVSRFEGKGLVNTFRNGDSGRGTLTSPPFRVERGDIDFLIGGGSPPGAARLPPPPAGEVGDLKGKPAPIRIVDKRTDGWGHVNVDSLLQSDEPRAEPVVADRLYQETWRPRFH